MPERWLASLRPDPAARIALTAWRKLSGGANDSQRRTLLACSGGIDSAALVLALASQATGVRSSLVIAHIVHDLRPAASARRDLKTTQELARLTGIRCVYASVRIKSKRGNAEANARAARYAALVKLAEGNECTAIATAHHADDQLETVLMRLIRGSGPRGLAGIRPVRLLRGTRTSIRLIRPLLELDRADTARLAAAVPPPWTPAVDETNADLTRLRNAIRANITPRLKELSPSVARRVSRNTRWFRSIAISEEGSKNSYREG